MKFKELVQKHQGESQAIADILSVHYEDGSDGAKAVLAERYGQVIAELIKTEPETSDFSILVEQEEDEGNKYFDVSGVGPVIEDELTNRLGIEGAPWAVWLDSEVDQKSLDTYGEITVLSHCLWELTWFGFTNEDVQQKARAMFSRLESDPLMWHAEG